MCSLQKNLTRLRGTNFCTSSALFAPSFVRQPNVPNAPKKYETHQNISLGSNGVDRVRSLRKIPTRLSGTNLCTNLTHFALSVVRQPKGPKCTQIVQNAPKCEVRVQWGGSGALGGKIPTRLRGMNLCTSSVPFCIEFCKATKQPEMHPKSRKKTKT